MAGRKAGGDPRKGYSVRVTKDDFEKLHAAASAAGVSMPEYVKQCVMHWVALAPEENPIRADLDAELEARRAQALDEMVSFQLTEAERKEWETAAGEHGVNPYVRRCLARLLEPVVAVPGNEPGD